MLDFQVLSNYASEYLSGFKITIYVSLIALICSFILGTLLAVMRISSVKPLRWIGTIYVEFVRNIPLILIVWIFFYGLSRLAFFKDHFQLDGFRAGTIGLTLYTAAFISEAIRAGIQSIPKGQMEAARSSGLTYNQAMRYIILPQAIKVVIPPLGNQFINLVKNSSVLGLVAGLDLMYHADIVNSYTYQTFSTYIFVGIFYLILTIPLSLFVGYLEKRLARTN